MSVSIPPIAQIPPVDVPGNATHLLIYVGQRGEIVIQPASSQSEMVEGAAKLRHGHGIATQVVKISDRIR